MILTCSQAMNTGVHHIQVNVTCAGILVVDLIAAGISKVSDPGEVTFVPVEMHIGGHSANVSIDLIELGMKKGEVSSVGAVGTDLLGDFIEQTMRAHGVKTNLIRTGMASTSKDLILVVKGEDRRFHFDVGANRFLDPKFVEKIMKKEKPRMLYIGAVGLLGEFDDKIVDVLRTAKGLGCITFVDPIRPFGKGWDFLLRAASLIDVFHCNDLEATEMTGTKDVENSVEKLLSRGVKLAVVTMGSRGLVAGHRNMICSLPAFKVETVDPTGAGDAFCSGVIRKLPDLRESESGRELLLDKDELVDLLVYGEAAGAVCVTAVGTTTAVKAENVEELLESQKRLVLKEAKRLR